MKVLFRKYKGDGQIIALFPEELWSRCNLSIASYMHKGQHGSADYETVIHCTTPAAPQEYEALYNELVSIGYKDLEIRIKSRPNYTKLIKQYESKRSPKIPQQSPCVG